MLILLTTEAMAQLKPQIQLAQASDNSFTKSKPAQLVATYPQNDTIENHFLVNAYLGVDFKLGSTFNLTLTGEQQRNTLVEKEQHVEQLGLTLGKTFVFKHEGKPVNGLSHEEHFLYWQFDLSGKYSNDKISKKEGSQWIWANAIHFPKAFKTDQNEASWSNYLRPFIFWPADEKVKRVRTDKSGKQDTVFRSSGPAKYLQIKHTHNLGLEFISTESLLMTNASFGLELYPLSGLLFDWLQQYGIWQISGSIAHRSNIIIIRKQNCM